MALQCMDDSQTEKLSLAATITWEKYSFDDAEKYGVLWMGGTLINKK
jgi:hypothetical protein